MLPPGAQTVIASKWQGEEAGGRKPERIRLEIENLNLLDNLPSKGGGSTELEPY